jgi:hypothetical protein
MLLLAFKVLLCFLLVLAGYALIPPSSTPPAPTAGTILVDFSARISNVEIDTDLSGLNNTLLIYIRGTKSAATSLQACQAGELVKNVSWHLYFDAGSTTSVTFRVPGGTGKWQGNRFVATGKHILPFYGSPCPYPRHGTLCDTYFGRDTPSLVVQWNSNAPFTHSHGFLSLQLPGVSVQPLNSVGSPARGNHYQSFVSKREFCPIYNYVIDDGRQPELAVYPGGSAPSAWQWYDTSGYLYGPVDIVEAHSLAKTGYDATMIALAGALFGAAAAVIVDAAADLFGLSVLRRRSRRRR